MKYTIMGFDQSTSVELGLDVVDLAILNWLVDFQATGKMQSYFDKNGNGEVYYWINYGYLIQQIPIIGISSPDQIGKRFKSMVDKGVLLVKKKKALEGTRMYYSTNTNVFYSLLFHQEKCEKPSHQCEKSGADPCQKQGAHPCEKQGNSSIKEDSPINDKEFSSDKSEEVVNKSDSKKTIQEYERLHKEKYSTSLLLDKSDYIILSKLTKDLGYEEVKRRMTAYFRKDYWFTNTRSVKGFRKHINEVGLEEKKFERFCGDCGTKLAGTSFSCHKCGWSIPL